MGEDPPGELLEDAADEGAVVDQDDKRYAIDFMGLVALVPKRCGCAAAQVALYGRKDTSWLARGFDFADEIT